MATPAMRPTKRSRRARQALIATAIAAFVGTSGGVASARTTSATTVNSATTRANASAKLAPSLVRVMVGGRRRAGDGLVVRADGYILTSADLVASTPVDPTIEVTTANGQRGSARVVGTEAGFAILQVTGLTDLTPATFATSAAVTDGQAVTSLGGALLDADGSVIGLYSSTATDHAIPADDAIRVAVELIAADTAR